MIRPIFNLAAATLGADSIRAYVYEADREIRCTLTRDREVDAVERATETLFSTM